MIPEQADAYEISKHGADLVKGWSDKQKVQLLGELQAAARRVELDRQRANDRRMPMSTAIGD